MRSTTKAVLALASAATLGTALLAGCSSDAGTTDAAAPAPSSSTLAGGDPSTWTPVSVTQEMNGQVIELRVGQVARFTDLPAAANITVETSDPNAVMPVQPSDTNGVTTVAGIKAVGLGAAHVIVWSGSPADSATEPLVNAIIQIYPVDASDSAPANKAPVEITAQNNSITMNSGETALFSELPAGPDYLVESSNDMTVMVLPTTVGATPGIIAVGTGDAKVVVTDGQGGKLAAASVVVN